MRADAVKIARLVAPPVRRSPIDSVGLLALSSLSCGNKAARSSKAVYRRAETAASFLISNLRLKGMPLRTAV
jgi:hypothetical protein